MHTKRTRNPVLGGLLVAVALVAAACGSSGSRPGGGADALPTATLSGSGATFPQAFYETVMAEFKADEPAVTVTYGGGGSGKGQTDLRAGLVQWAGSDSTVESDEVSKFQGRFLYFPTVAAPITVAYNLSAVGELRLSPDTLAGIFAGAITSWDDTAVKADNPDVDLPSKDIVVVHRSDGSGTTSNFTTYLTKAAPTEWTLGADKTVPWPANQRAENGNAGVAQAVASTSGAIGYIDFSDAKASGLVFAEIENKSGRFVAPTLESATAALDGVTLAPDLTYDPLDAAGQDAYPITAPTYVLAHQDQPDHAVGIALAGYLRYLLTEGQDLAETVDFAPLPPSIRSAALAQVDRLEVAP